MLKRLLPTLVALALGLCALGVGLVLLQRIFIDERDGARAQLAARRAALEQYAEQALRQSLHARLVEAAPAIALALRDPLASDANLFYADAEGQRLPRVFHAFPLPPGEGQGEGADDPWSERQRLFTQFDAALKSKDKKQI